jgi:PAS domain S-box-containing protein
LGGAIESWNRGAEELYGFSETEAVGRVTHDLLQTVPAPWAEIEAQLRDTGRWEGELRHRAKDGREVVVSARKQMVPGPRGAARVMETIRDVTERKRAEDALRASEEKYRNLFANMAEEVHFWRVVRDEAGNIRTWHLVDANPPTLKTWGRRRAEEIRGMTTDEIFGPGATEHYLPVVRKIFATGAPLSFEDYFPNLDKYFRFTSVPLGEFFITTGADITAIKKAEAAARENERHFRLVTESLPQLVWTYGADSLCDYLSPQWVRYTGKSEAEQLGYGWLEQVHPDDRARVAEQWRATSARGENFETEYRVRRHDGGYRWFRGLAVPLHDEAGRVVQWFGSNTDIDDIKEAEQALREADRRKDEFLAMLGHELRNPIGSISNCVRTLGLGVDGAKAADMRDIMARQVEHLVRLVEDLLDVARISHGRIELRKERVDLAQIIKDAIAASQPLVVDFRHRLTVSLPSAPLPLEADPTRFAQVLINLINNAAKFTAPGGCIDISARGGDGEAMVSVRDNGIGVPAEELPRIFDLFAQFDRGLDQPRGGLGIGLALARRIVECTAAASKPGATVSAGAANSSCACP